MISDNTVKGLVVGAGVTALFIYLYKNNNKKINSLAKNAVSSISGNFNSLKKMNNEKLEELKENIDDILIERKSNK